MMWILWLDPWHSPPWTCINSNLTWQTIWGKIILKTIYTKWRGNTSTFFHIFWSYKTFQEVPVLLPLILLWGGDYLNKIQPCQHLPTTPSEEPVFKLPLPIFSESTCNEDIVEYNTPMQYWFSQHFMITSSSEVCNLVRRNMFKISSRVCASRCWFLSQSLLDSRNVTERLNLAPCTNIYHSQSSRLK